MGGTKEGGPEMGDGYHPALNGDVPSSSHPTCPPQALARETSEVDGTGAEVGV
jgi:hypothetical protein